MGRFEYRFNGDYLSESTNITPVVDIAKDIANLFRKKIEEVGAVANGDLRDFKGVLTFNNQTLELVFDLPNYWRWLEDGRPPTQNEGSGELLPQIERWIRIKNIQPKPVVQVWQTKKGITRNRATIPSRKTLAFLITRKIHRFGYSGRHPYKMFMDDVKNNGLITKLTTAISSALAKEFQTFLYEN